jgi:hypothetical protein
LQARVSFAQPYFEQTRPLFFVPSTGDARPVRSFGNTKREPPPEGDLARQPELLFQRRSETDRYMAEEFAIDLDRHSQPNQIVVACVPKGATLLETYAALQAKIAAFPADPAGRDLSHAVLTVPNLNWRIDHRFRELEGPDKAFDQAPLQGSFLDTARQTIDFRLDRSGAELTSSASIWNKSAPPAVYNLDRPFLIYLKNRAARQPFFVLWVDNAELLEPWQP